MARIDGLKRGYNGEPSNHFMQHHILYELLEERGLWSRGKLIDGGGYTFINGVPVTVQPKAAPEYYRYSNRPIKSSKHRVFAQCDCGRQIPFGRLGQHRKACKA